MQAPLFLSALDSSTGQLRLQTLRFSPDAFAAMAAEEPVAITFSSRGALDLERLVEVSEEDRQLLASLQGQTPGAVVAWRCYVLAPNASELTFEATVDLDELRAKVDEIAKQAAALQQVLVYTFLPAARSGVRRDHRLGEFISKLIERSLVGPRRTSPRERLNHERREMLAMVGSYTSEELAAAAGSTTSNASQFAADQRNAGGLFGVRSGQAWRYPKFQFDQRHRVFKEMKAVLNALGADEQGWDRLQWFLEPHEKLEGSTPLLVWQTDRQKVIEAAQSERWHGRD
jgi:hypothetical protein